MHDLKKYLETPFVNIEVGKDKQYKFYEDHENRMISAVNNGEPFDALLAATHTTVLNLKHSLGSQASTLAEKESKTITVDNAIEEFKTKIKEREANILVKFPKKSAIYEQFYPHGKTEYNSATKANIEKLMTQFIEPLDDHKGVLGTDLLDEFTAIETNYINARNEQLQKKEDSETSRYTWDASLAAMEDQAFVNLLSIAIVHRNHPEKIKMFFDQSIIRPHKYNKAGEEILPYILGISVNTTQAADISFSVDDQLEIENTGDGSIFYYGAITADAICPPTAKELPSGESIIVKGDALGAPANKYLLFTNKNANLEGEVEISLLID